MGVEHWLSSHFARGLGKGRRRQIHVVLMGWGFYMLHAVIAGVMSANWRVAARGSAMALHSFFFFMGQTVGPIAYGFGITNAGKIPTLLASAIVIAALGFVCARWLRQTVAADAA